MKTIKQIHTNSPTTTIQITDLLTPDIIDQIFTLIDTEGQNHEATTTIGSNRRPNHLSRLAYTNISAEFAIRSPICTTGYSHL